MSFKKLVLLQTGALIISGICLFHQFSNWEWESEVISEFTFIFYWFIGGLTLIIPNDIVLDIFQVSTNKWLRISVYVTSALVGFILFSFIFMYLSMFIYPIVCLYSLVAIIVYNFMHRS